MSTSTLYFTDFGMQGLMWLRAPGVIAALFPLWGHHFVSFVESQYKLLHPLEVKKLMEDGPSQPLVASDLSGISPQLYKELKDYFSCVPVMPFKKKINMDP